MPYRLVNEVVKLKPLSDAIQASTQTILTDINAQYSDALCEQIDRIVHCASILMPDRQASIKQRTILAQHGIQIQTEDRKVFLCTEQGKLAF